MPSENGLQVEVRNNIAGNEDKVACNQITIVKIAHTVSNGGGRGFEDVEALERGAWKFPSRAAASVTESDSKSRTETHLGNKLDVLLDLVCMRSRVEKDIVDACAREEFKSVFDQGRVCKGQQTLLWLVLALVLGSLVSL